MSFVDATGIAKGAGGGTALTGGTATTISGAGTPFAGTGGKASGGGTALSGGTAVTISTKAPSANPGGKAAGGGTALTGGTAVGGASTLAGAASEAGSQPCNAMSTYSTPSNCGRVPVASLAPTPVPTQPAGPVWVPTR